MKPMTFLLPALAALVLAAPAALAQGEPFRIVNRTTELATALHAVRSGRPDWGGNLLNRGPLRPGAQFSLRPSEGAGCSFDLRLVLGDGQEVVRRNTNICAQRTVEMTLPLGLAPRVVPGSLPDSKPPPEGTPGPAGPATPPGARPNPQARVSSGTGFVVADGRVMTNHHVIEACSRIFVRTADSRALPVTERPVSDPRRDLALLRVSGNAGPVLAFRANPVRRGESVVTYGFPLAGLLSSGPTLTTGEVSALSGLGDNQTQFQISAPVQQGNSGGPLLDRQGNVIGVIVSKLNAARIAQRTGDIPQNVNFAVKGTEAVDFLRRNGVTPVMRDSPNADRNAAEIGEQAHPSTVFIRCER
ncbi:trypsin-like peptidase domain-containing protein [Roseomonas terrae]|jgi:serine protease Do|uniref:Trypsin-like peptidase domain-containing protein n=1 Tax=Neoroseomonas terrae TaxID=424799 RepID=A0ABS5EPJ9_9PROT|nr:trypsin-like peptidase domain-containing protein [Neoroseomonas terrae]MBR0652936.1 trypsin-like peptidase domain-containing protein [Neoroseomonas terrae]